jgi:hypothetical protein
MTEGSSFSGLLTRVEIGHIRIGSAGNGLIGSLGFARRSVADVGICREYHGEIELSALTRTPVGLGGTHPSGFAKENSGASGCATMVLAERLSLTSRTVAIS